MTTIEMKRDEAVKIYRDMLRIRFFEEKVADLYRESKILGSVHTYRGEEAVAAGVCANLRRDDYITSTHRSHGHCISKGTPLNKIMAEILGRMDGCCHGKGGSMHIVDFSVGNLGANGIVGAGIPIAVGAGLSIRLRGTDQVAVCFFGDGAVNQGTFHEGINMASIWDLPVIFVCENNLYSTWTRQSDVMRIRDIATKATGYGITGIVADGNNAIEVHETSREAIQRAREGKGPTLIEYKTYRFSGHHEGDTSLQYRPKEEEEKWKKRDPVERFTHFLLESFKFDEKELKIMEEEVIDEVKESVIYAEDSPFPPVEETVKDIYFTHDTFLNEFSTKPNSRKEVKEISYREAIREALIEEMTRDERVFIYGQGYMGIRGGAFAIVKGLQDIFGKERVRDAPISESAMAGCALGAALTGMRPVVEIMFMDWITLAMDQIVNQVAKIRYISGGQVKVPLTIRASLGALSSAGPQHSQSFESWFMHVPGLKVAVPSTPYDAKGLLKMAIRDENPILFLEHKDLYNLKGSVPPEDYVIPFGQADVKREGNDVTLLATSKMVYIALKAAEDLSKKGIDVEVIDPRTLVPFDKQTLINSVKKTNRVVIIHEACKTGGIAGEITSILIEEAFDYLDAPIMRVAALDTPVPFSPILEKFFLPNEDKIIEAVKKIIH
jgi:pyruvate/2-oxoglutarate/acetoin dehydrogenase E1 component/TPP-dependent pyruvate/acetoin dehydrogenase alpha subunit